MIKDKRCTKFEADEAGRCKWYGGTLKHLAACYDECNKREKVKTEKDRMRIELDKCYTGTIIE